MARLKQKENASAKVEEFLEKGKRALADHEYEMAIQYFRQLVKQYPSEEDYRKLLNQAELERAKSQVNFLTRPIYTLWAILLVYLFGAHKAGIGVARVLAKSKPSSKLATQLYATCCMKAGLREEGIQAYERFLREKPFDEGILYKLSKIYYDSLDYPNAVRTLDALRKIRPEDVEISKMYDVAITQKYTSEGTDIKKLQRIDEERRKVEEKQPRLDEKKVNALIEQCKENPEDVNLRIRLGKMLMRGHQWEQAAGVFEAAMDLAPEDPRIIEDLVELYDKLSRIEEADALLERLAEITPDDQELKKKILDRKIARGMQQASDEEQQEGVATLEDESIEELRQQRLDLEIEDYRQRIKENPANPDLYLQLGKLLRQRGDLDEAITCFQQAARNPTRAFQGSKLLGETFYEKGMLEIAAEQLIKARDRASAKRDFMTSDLKEIHYLLSVIHEELGDLDQAIEFMKPIYEEDMNYKDVRERFEQFYEKRRKQAKKGASSDIAEEASGS